VRREYIEEMKLNITVFNVTVCGEENREELKLIFTVFDVRVLGGQ
jgi:Ca2+-binding EF-hand superfamily protein